MQRVRTTSSQLVGLTAMKRIWAGGEHEKKEEFRSMATYPESTPVQTYHGRPHHLAHRVRATAASSCAPRSQAVFSGSDEACKAFWVHSVSKLHRSNEAALSFLVFRGRNRACMLPPRNKGRNSLSEHSVDRRLRREMRCMKIAASGGIDAF